MAVGGPPGMPIPAHMLEQDMIGAIKIKDGLFIGDELASTVSKPVYLSGTDLLDQALFSSRGRLKLHALLADLSDCFTRIFNS